VGEANKVEPLPRQLDLSIYGSEAIFLQAFDRLLVAKQGGHDGREVKCIQ
jgi:hypothetical protein